MLTLSVPAAVIVLLQQGCSSASIDPFGPYDLSGLGDESPGHECEKAGGYCMTSLFEGCPIELKALDKYCAILDPCCTTPDAGADAERAGD